MKIHQGVTKGCTVNIGENSSNVLTTIAMLQKLTSLGAVNIDARLLTRGQAETAVGSSAMAICRGNACARTRVRSTANEAKWLAEKRSDLLRHRPLSFSDICYVMQPVVPRRKSWDIVSILLSTMDVARHEKSRLLQLDVQRKLNSGFYEFRNDSLVIWTWNGDFSHLFAKSFFENKRTKFLYIGTSRHDFHKWLPWLARSLISIYQGDWINSVLRCYQL